MFLSQGYGVLLLSLMHGLPSSITSLSINWYQSNFALVHGSGAKKFCTATNTKTLVSSSSDIGFQKFQSRFGGFQAFLELLVMSDLCNSAPKIFCNKNSILLSYHCHHE